MKFPGRHFPERERMFRGECWCYCRSTDAEGRGREKFSVESRVVVKAIQGIGMSAAPITLLDAGEEQDTAGRGN